MSQQYIRRNVRLEAPTSVIISRNTDIDRVMVLDVETTMDFSQHARVGYYLVKQLSTDTILDAGVFYDTVTTEERTILENYAASFMELLQTHATEHQTQHQLDNPGITYSYPFNDILDYYNTHQLRIMNLQQFIQQRLYLCLMNGVAVVNHNIPFDLGAIATSSQAYGNDGFILKLCDCMLPSGVKSCEKHPSIVTRRLAGKKANIYVDTDSSNVGAVLDTVTIGRALLGPGDLSLKGMGKRFKCDIRKSTSDEHGNTLTYDYLTYMVNDVLATMNLFQRQISVYHQHGLDTPITSIMSEASIGKAYFHQLGIPPFLQLHNEIPSWIYGCAMNAYYGARSEVKIRLTPTEIRYCDFKSQYPTVNALLGLQDLLIADSIQLNHCKQKAQHIINTIELHHLQQPSVWKKLRILVKVIPDGDILPVRFDEKVAGKGTKKVYAVCKLHSTACWYTLCDVVASKLLTGKAATIIDAIELRPYGKIETSTINLFENEKYSIDLSRDDLFTKVIDLRTDAKQAMKPLDKDSDEYAYLDSLQLALKLIANSTAYGVLVETRSIHGDDVAGKYYAVPVATHITGAARLLLAIAERLGVDAGIPYAACDTDSMMYARLPSMDKDTFRTRVDNIVQWFTPLSPYAKDSKGVSPALFELEDMNFITDKDTSAMLQQLNINPTTVDDTLYFLGVSCKRYCLYNKLPDGTLLLRKISAHATGRYQFDRTLPLPSNVVAPTPDSLVTLVCDIPDDIEDSEADDTTIPTPSAKWKMYQYIMWYRAVQIAESGHVPYIPIEEWSKNSVRYQETITTPGKLNQHSYVAGIRPYTFLTEMPTQDVPNTSKRAKHPTTKAKYRYYMSFAATEDELKQSNVYRTGTGEIDTAPTFEPLYIRFKDFFNNPEMKAQNGLDCGIMNRREIWLDTITERTRTGKKLATPMELELEW